MVYTPALKCLLLGLCMYYIPVQPVAHNYGLLSVNNELLWGIVAYYFGPLGVPGTFDNPLGIA